MSDLSEETYHWGMATFGPNVMGDKREQVIRFLEEAMELAQSLGLDVEDTLRIAQFVFQRKPGKPRKEIGDVAIMLSYLSRLEGTTIEDAHRQQLSEVIGRSNIIREKRKNKPAFMRGRY